MQASGCNRSILGVCKKQTFAHCAMVFLNVTGGRVIIAVPSDPFSKSLFLISEK